MTFDELYAALQTSDMQHGSTRRTIDEALADLAVRTQLPLPDLEVDARESYVYNNGQRYEMRRAGLDPWQVFA